MAQRSARARSKLDKITQQNEEKTATVTAQRRSAYGRAGLGGGLGGGARLGSGGLLTPSASSVSGSSITSSQRVAPQRVGKGWKSLFQMNGDQWKKGVGLGASKGKEEGGLGAFYTAIGGGLHGMNSMSTIGEEKVQVKKWEGAGRGEYWDGFGKGKKDLELWFQDGDTIVFLSEKPNTTRNAGGLYKPPTPQPAFRLRSSVLKQLNSPFLNAQLEESSGERPVTPASAKLPASIGVLEGMDYEYELRRTRTLDTNASTPSVNTTHTAENGIRYHLYFPAPPRLDREDCLRHQLTTRNFFAVLFGRPLVGITLGQSLLDLVERIDLYLSTSISPAAYDLVDRGVGEVESPYGSFIGSNVEKQKPPSHPNTNHIILNYLLDKEFDDVRNWPEGASGLLIYSEWVCTSAQNGTVQMSALDRHRAESLWRECFVHCAGQLSLLHLQPEWRDISPVTKAFADRASLEIQVRASKADERLRTFNFNDMWPMQSANHPPARIAYEKFQKFLQKHYHSRFGSWPPQEGRFTRTLYLHLQRDFTALYDYLVDRDAVWSPSWNEEATTRRIIKPNNTYWRADDEYLAITDILQRFDTAENHPPMPRPYPLVPVPPPARLGNHSSASAQNPNPPQKRQQRFFASTGSSSIRGRVASNPAMALALSESTNIEALYSSKTINPLVEAFNYHEKSLPASDIAPHDARKGRWIMIYGVLQTLASIAVDAPGIKWIDGVEYPLNARLRGTPPWSHKHSDIEQDERSHFRSHCWVSARAPVIIAELPTSSPPSSSHSILPIPHKSSRRNMRDRDRSASRTRRLQRELELRGPPGEFGVENADTMEIEAQRSGDEGDNEDDDFGEGRQSPGSDFESPPPSGWSTKVMGKKSKGEMRSSEEVHARTRIAALMNPARD